MRFIPWWLVIGAAAIAAVLVASSEPQVQMVVAGVALVFAMLWQARRRRRRRIRDWRDAEVATARWLRRAGCRRVTLTGGSADGGIDVITAGWVVQVKHTAKRVGRPAVQQLVGAALSLDRSPALFSTSGFSAPACAYALEHDVALFELDMNGAAHAINRPARRVGRGLRRISPLRTSPLRSGRRSSDMV